MIRQIYSTTIRTIVKAAMFAFPQEKRIATERRLRGKFEHELLQDSDAVLVSFGKSGRTWLRVMLSRVYQVKHDLPENMLLSFDNLHKKNPAVPKIFISHDNYLKDYTGNSKNKADYYDKKVVLLARNPLDIAVSQFFQWKYRMKPSKKVLNNYPSHDSDIDIYSFVMGADAGLPKIIDYLNLWASEAESVKNLLIVRYEDMRANPEKELGRITDFLDTPASEEEINEAVRFASVDNMRNMETKRTFWLSGSRMVAKDKNNPNSFKVRKAKVGGYTDYFDDKQIRNMKELVSTTLNPIFNYEK